MDGITIKPDGKGRLRVPFPFPKARIEQIKRIPGRRWLPDDKAWSAPDTPEVRQALADLLTTPLPFPATTITVAPHKPKAHERRTRARRPRHPSRRSGQAPAAFWRGGLA